MYICMCGELVGGVCMYVCMPCVQCVNAVCSLTQGFTIQISVFCVFYYLTQSVANYLWQPVLVPMYIII